VKVLGSILGTGALMFVQVLGILLFLAVNPEGWAASACPRVGQWPAESNVVDLMVCVQDLTFPPTGSPDWDTVDPAELGWDTSVIDPLYTYLEEQNSRGFLVLWQGRIALEQYWGENLSGQPFDQDSYWYWASAAKTMTAALIGIAQFQGYLDLDDPSSLYLGEGWTSLSQGQESEITVWHQLTMTSGLDDGVQDPYCTDPACLQFLAEPGTRWAYHNAPYTKLDGVLEDATATDFSIYFNTFLRDPIGMQGFWIYSGFNHLYLSTPRDMARYGLLILNEGIWDGDVVLEDPDYVQAMVEPSQTINPSYGYLWWLNGQATYMLPGLQLSLPGPLVPAAPDDLVAAMGKNGQLINVVPSMGLVVVRMGDNPDQSLVPLFFQRDMWEYISAMVQP